MAAGFIQLSTIQMNSAAGEVCSILDGQRGSNLIFSPLNGQSCALDSLYTFMTVGGRISPIHASYVHSWIIGYKSCNRLTPLPPPNTHPQLDRLRDSYNSYS